MYVYRATWYELKANDSFQSDCTLTYIHVHVAPSFPFPFLSLLLSLSPPPSQIGQQVVPKEVALLNCLKHKYVIKMLDHFEDHENFYIVMERPEKYIDLFDYISGKRVMSERSARFLFRQVWEVNTASMQHVQLHHSGTSHSGPSKERVCIVDKPNAPQMIANRSDRFADSSVSFHNLQ